MASPKVLGATVAELLSKWLFYIIKCFSVNNTQNLTF